MNKSHWDMLRGSEIIPMKFSSWISSFEHELDCIHAESGAVLEPEFDRSVADEQQYSIYLSCFGDASDNETFGPVYPDSRSFSSLIYDFQIDGDLNGIESETSNVMFVCEGVVDRVYLPIDASYMMFTDSDVIFSDVNRHYIFHYRTSIAKNGISLKSYRAFEGSNLKAAMSDILTPIKVLSDHQPKKVSVGKMIFRKLGS